MTKRMAGFQKPTAAKVKPVGLALIKVGPGEAVCNCGWHSHHQRVKVLGDRAQAHVDKKHGGEALWM